MRELETELGSLDAQLLQMQRDLDAAQEALVSSQQLAAEREVALKQRLSAQTEERDRREAELRDALDAEREEGARLAREAETMRDACDEAEERAEAEAARAEGLALEQVIAVGDGANDLPMLRIAGLGIAFHAKPRVYAAADTALSAGGLDRVLYLLGLRQWEVEELLSEADEGF